MTRKSVGLAAVLTVATLAGASAWVALSLPGDVQLPVHWGLDGEADRFSGKWTALMMPPLIVAAVSLLFFFLPSLEPRKQGLERSQGLYLWGWIAMLLMGTAIELAVVSTALGWDLPVNRLITGGVGATLLLIGNQLGKSRSMYLIGLRTPWTLASEEVWIRTHRLAGKLMVLAGLLIMAGALLPLPPAMLMQAMLAIVVATAAVPIVYSYLLWRREGQASE
jgi:uncharacterized membrane protein